MLTKTGIFHIFTRHSEMAKMKVTTRCTILFVVILAIVILPIRAQCKPSDQLVIDPLLILEAEEVWSVIGQPHNDVWPGWDASSTPLLFYFPNKQDVLINHPNPPEGFVPYTGPIRFSGGKIFVRSGKTIEEFDGQNTSVDVNGATTLVVADTLSSRRMAFQSVAEYVRSGGDKLDDVIGNALISSPMDAMQMIAHEAFHVYQNRRAPDKGGNEFVLTRYPSVSVENNVDIALESDCLLAALRTADDATCRSMAKAWLGLRTTRRQRLDKDLTDYEDGTEFSEGTAKYIEYRLMQVLEKRTPEPKMWWIQGFTGYEDLSPQRDEILKQMSEMMCGKGNVNNDLYGASPVRMRLYFSGMGIAALLDRLNADWHDKIFQPVVSLTSLVNEELHASVEELTGAAAQVRRGKRYDDLLVEKKKLAEDGQIYITKALGEMEKAPGKVIIDYSAIPNPNVKLAYTPFGILRVDDNRSMFRLVPLQGRIGDFQFRESEARPVLQDRDKKQIIFTLPTAITHAMIERLPNGSELLKAISNVGQCEITGISFSGGKARMEIEQGALTIRLSALSGR